MLIYNSLMDYFLYARKSTDVEDKQVRSIEDQLSVLRALAKEHGLHVAREFTEKRTAKVPGRPIFNEMMDKIESGEAQGILCWKLDRLSRNPWDDGKIRWFHQTGIIQHVRTYEHDYQSSDNGLLMSVELATATQYVRDLAQNTMRGLHEKAKRGEYPSLAPIGYLNDRNVKKIVLDGATAKIVRIAFERYAEGNFGLKDISVLFAKHHIYSKNKRPLKEDRIKYILSNPFYCGLFRYAGQLYEGKHPALISKTLFDKVQEVMKSRGWARKEDDPMPLCGLLKCAECGCSITAEIKTKHQKNGNVHTYAYYHCTKKRGACSQPCVREEELTKQLNEAIRPFSLPSEWAAELSLMADEDEKEAIQSSAAASQALRDEITGIADKLKRLHRLYLDQDIEREAFLTEKADLLSSKKSLEEKMALLAKGRVAWLEPLRGWIKEAQNLNETTETTPLSAKKSTAQKIFGSNLFLNSRLLVSTPTPPYASLREARLNFLENDNSVILVGVAGIGPATSSM